MINLVIIVTEETVFGRERERPLLEHMFHLCAAKSYSLQIVINALKM